jgi:hypothetical protein
VFLGSNFSMVPTPTLLDIPFNWKFKMAAVKRKFPYLGPSLGTKKISKVVIVLSGTTNARIDRATLDALLTTPRAQLGGR